MRVEPLGADQGQACGFGHPTLIGAAVGLLLPLMIFLSRSLNLIGVRLTTGTSRTIRSVTESKPGVANKVYHNSGEVPGPVHPALARAVTSKPTAAVFCSWTVTVLGDLL